MGKQWSGTITHGGKDKIISIEKTAKNAKKSKNENGQDVPKKMEKTGISIPGDSRRGGGEFSDSARSSCE